MKDENQKDPGLDQEAKFFQKTKGLKILLQPAHLSARFFKRSK